MKDIKIYKDVDSYSKDQPLLVFKEASIIPAENNGWLIEISEDTYTHLPSDVIFTFTEE